VSRLKAATVTTSSRAMERFIWVLPPPDAVFLGRRVAVPAHLGAC
jgi:hypothetical protein